MKKLLGSVELFLAAFIWGFGFVAQTAGSEHIPTFTFSFLRSYIAFVFLAVLIFIVSKVQKENTFPKNSAQLKQALIGGVCCGFVLFVSMNLQQFGIALYTRESADIAASGRASFITALYVVFVAVVSPIILKQKNHLLVWLGVVISLVGLYLLCFGNGIGGLYVGDISLLLCAITFCGHILTVNHFVKKTNGIILSCIQFFTVGTLSMIAMFIFDTPDWSLVGHSLLPVIYLGIMSSGVAYTLQIVGQANTPPTIASILMSLESVFGVIGGWIVLGEKLSAKELIGCALVFIAIIVAQIPDFLNEKKAA